jgi:hypothetical protein
VHKLLWIEEVLVVTEISDNVLDILDEIPKNLNIRTDLLFADIEISLVLPG